MGEDAVSPLLDNWRKVTDKLDELQQWLVRAADELTGAKKSDPRWLIYNNVEAAAERLDKELEEIEKKQLQALEAHLASVGPVTIELEDGSRRVIAATPRTAGGTADLLPADLLRVWRAAEVFHGSVVGLDGKPKRLEFGDAETLEWFKPKKKRR